MKRIIKVRFKGTPEKWYSYYTNLSLTDFKYGHKYFIKCDNGYPYANPIYDWKFTNNTEYKGSLVTILGVKEVETPVPNDRVKKVIFDVYKRTTVVLWEDGSKTIVHCAPDDVFDKEKGLALCFMKKSLENRSSFNETLKRWC